MADNFHVIRSEMVLRGSMILPDMVSVISMCLVKLNVLKRCEMYKLETNYLFV